MPKTVLLADDSVTIQHAVGISLANEDIALVNVSNGEDAVIKARALKPDLILLDVVMPKVSGYDACRQIRQDPSIKHTPVIMLVGAIEGYDEKRFKESMANDYIIKPFESGALINKVRKFLYPELSKSVVTQPKITQPTPPVVQPSPVIPNIPIPPQQINQVSTPSTNPQIPIPPKPVVPPIVPPVIPSQTPSIQNVPSTQSQLAALPPMPPHIPSIQKPQKAESHLEETTKEVTNFVDNLIPPPKVTEPPPAQEVVDEISPADIEEITSEIPELSGKEEQVTPPSVIDIISQVEKSVGVEPAVESAPVVSESKTEEPRVFDMEEWGKDLKKEIMEASGLTVAASVNEKEMAKELSSVEVTPPTESSAQMQVETIAESIGTEPVGEPVKAVEVNSADIPIPAQVEPTSLVEQKIDLCSPLSEEAVKQVREVVERVVWEIVPELAERLIKEEIKRLMSEKED
ncbi:MAG: response regulator [Myxococcota bacterium]